MMNKKKRIIIISSVLATILLFVILSSTLFSLKYVSVEYKTSTVYFNETMKTDIVNDGNFKFGKNILFTNFDNQIENIETKYPYAKVVNVERIFPNSAIVHIKERKPAVKIVGNNGEMLIIDSEMKVLNIIYAQSNYNNLTGEDNVPVLSIYSNVDININKPDVLSGYVESEKLNDWVSDIYNGSNFKDYGIGFLDTINVSYLEELECYQFEIKFDSIPTKVVIRSDNDLKQVITNVFAIIDTYGSKYSKILVSKTGEFFVEV